MGSALACCNLLSSSPEQEIKSRNCMRTPAFIGEVAFRLSSIFLLGTFNLMFAGIDLDPRSHRRGDGDTLDVVTLRARWTCLVHGIHQRGEVIIQVDLR